MQNSEENAIFKTSQMDEFNCILPLAKITPVLDKTIFDTYIVTPEICLPLNYFHNYGNIFPNKEICSPLQISELNGEICGFEFHESICFCLLSSFKTVPLSRIKLKISPLLFSIIMNELKRSRTFRLNVLKSFYDSSKKKYKNLDKELKTCLFCNKVLWVLHVNAILSKPTENVLDYKWNKKLEVLINERCELENAMAWLSTLGGAFSALGDYFTECAEKAGLISIQQFRIALRLGDPVTICQCKIYLAISLIQRGYYFKAKNLIRELYAFSIGPEGSKDFRLKNMCIAVWNKLKYVLSEKKENQMFPE